VRAHRAEHRAMRRRLPLWLCALSFGAACSSGSSSDATGTDSGGASDGATADTSSTDSSAADSSPTDSSPIDSAPSDASTDGPPSYDDVSAWIDAYKAAHPGNGGKDWDINAKTPSQLAADPDAQRLVALCGDGRRPVIPLLAWEYGGSDHPWIHPELSALVYCVYVPASPSTDHWSYDAATDHVTADVYVLYPDHNPCKDTVGADQVAGCIGDPTNFEILVDTASLNDGADVGLSLASASSELMLILVDGTKVHLYSSV
jgi:hypothetical protein